MAMRLESFKTASNGAAGGHTLVEVLISMTILALATVMTINGYVFCSRRAEWSAHSLAAHSLALQRLEQTRAAIWNLTVSPVVDQVVQTNFPSTTNLLDLPVSGTNIFYATNFTTITTVSTAPPLKLVRVDCVWPFIDGRTYTNTLMTYRSPEQ
jgi:type II secretory pathway pseudopilin PulG